MNAIESKLWASILRLLDADGEASRVALAKAIRESIACVVASGVVPDGFTPKAFMRILLALQEEYANRS